MGISRSWWSLGRDWTTSDVLSKPGVLDVLRERGSRPVAGKAFLPQLTLSSSSQSLTFSAAVQGANRNEP